MGCARAGVRGHPRSVRSGASIFKRLGKEKAAIKDMEKDSQEMQKHAWKKVMC